MRDMPNKHEPCGEPLCPAGEQEGVLLSACGPAAAYLRTEIATATPRRIRQMLYDSAINLCRQAVEALDAGDLARAADRFDHARRVIRQLQNSLPACRDRQFFALYEQVHRRLGEAEHYRCREIASETLSLLDGQRDLWQTLTATLPASGQADMHAPEEWVG